MFDVISVFFIDNDSLNSVYTKVPTNLKCIFSHLQVIHQALPVLSPILHFGLDPLHPVPRHHCHQQITTHIHCTQPGLPMFPVTQELLRDYTDKRAMSVSELYVMNKHTAKREKAVKKRRKKPRECNHSWEV